MGIINPIMRNEYSKITCPALSCKYTYKDYKKHKYITLGVVAVIGIMCVIGIWQITDTKIQTLASALFGGVLSVFVWALSTFVTDNMEHEQAEIDRLIRTVELHISDIQSEIMIEYFDKYKREPAPDYALIKYGHLANMIMAINNDKDLDVSEYRLDWYGKKISIEEFLAEYQEIFENGKFEFEEQELQNMVIWNIENLVRDLIGLKNKLLKARNYILSGDPKDSPSK